MEVHKDKFAELLKAREAVQAHEPRSGVDRRLSGRRQLHAAALRPEHRPEQQRLRADSRSTTRSTSSTAQMPPGPERDKLYQEMTRITRGVRAVAADDQPLSQPADPAAGRGLQEAPDPARAVAVSGREGASRRGSGRSAGRGADPPSDRASLEFPRLARRPKDGAGRGARLPASRRRRARSACARQEVKHDRVHHSTGCGR